MFLSSTLFTLIPHGSVATSRIERIFVLIVSLDVHKVITGCAFCFDGKTYSFSDTSLVEFYTLSESEIDEYLDTGEYADKAGAYGIQGFGSVLVRRIEGDFFNIVGLPVARLKREMQKFIENVITNEEK